jgi:hypothetical protein
MEKSFVGGKYAITPDESRKVIECLGEGLFTEQVVAEYNETFCTVADKYADKGYSLIIDVVNMKPVSKEVLQKTLHECGALYVSPKYNFKKVIFLKMTSNMFKYEIKGMGIMNNQKVQWVNNKEEAYSLL